MRPDSEPANTASLCGDLQARAEQYLDEMSSEPGRTMMRDVQYSQTPWYCVALIGGQWQVIVDRYTDSTAPSVERLVNLLAAPTVFRMLFSTPPLAVDELHTLIDLARKN